MATYRYKAINETGNTLSGTLEADSIQNANAILASRGLIPTAVAQEDSRSKRHAVGSESKL